jgi:hypothetical protein
MTLLTPEQTLTWPPTADLFRFGIPHAAPSAKRLDASSYVNVFQNKASGLPVGTDGNIHHCPSQIVGAYHLIGE